MNHYLSVIIIFGIFILGGFAGALQMLSKGSESQLQADQANVARSTAEMISRNLETEVQRGQRHSRLMDRFVEEWESHVSATKDQEEFHRKLLNRLMAITGANQVSPSINRPNTIQNYDFAGTQISGMSISWNVTGRYAQLMNMLGQIEQEFPLMRVERVVLNPPAEQGQSSAEILQMSIEFFYPYFDGKRFSFPGQSDAITEEKINQTINYLSLFPSLKEARSLRDDARRPFEFTNTGSIRRVTNVNDQDRKNQFSAQVRDILGQKRINGVIPTTAQSQGMIVIDNQMYRIGDPISLGENNGSVRLIQIRRQEYLVSATSPSGDIVTVSIPVSMFGF